MSVGDPFAAHSLMALVEDELATPKLLAQLERERAMPGPVPFDWPSEWARREIDHERLAAERLAEWDGAPHGPGCRCDVHRRRPS